MNGRVHSSMDVKQYLIKVAAVLFFVLSFTFTNGQDVQFSIPQLTRLYINPASSGEFDAYRANFNYRSQWKSVGTPFTSMSGSFDMLLLGSTSGASSNNGRLGAGLNFLTDQLDPDGQKILMVNTAVAYHIQLNANSTLGAGINIGFDQRSISADHKWASQYTGIQFDPGLSSGEAFPEDSESNLDLGAGIVYHSSQKSKKRGWELNRKISLGIAAYHVGRINLSKSQYLTSELKPRYSFYAALQLPFGEKVAVLPQYYHQLQNGSMAAMYGVSLKYLVIAGNSFLGDTKPMSVQAGFLMRNSDALTLTAGLNWSNYTLILAYDVSVGLLKEYSNRRGAYEIGIAWKMHEAKKR